MEFQVPLISMNESGTMIAIGSLEGLLGIKLLGSEDGKKAVAMRGHVTQQGNCIEAFPINDISWLRGTSKLVTAGSDGKLLLWDLAKQKSVFEYVVPDKHSATAVCFSEDRKIVAFSSGYDWH